MIHSNSSNNNSNTNRATNESCCHGQPIDYSPGTSRKASSIDVVLDGKSLWDEFCRRGTEMIVNRSGR